MAKSDEKEELLRKIKADFELAETVYNKQRDEAEEDIKFVAGDQWEDRVKTIRQSQNRPVLVFNQLDQHVRQLVNIAKQNKPSINYSALDSQADDQTALVMQSIVKDIESKSLAECAYDKAYENMCITGEGYIKVETEYVDDYSFDQQILIKAIDGIDNVYIDPSFTSDYSNINWAFHFTNISVDEFEVLYPNAETVYGSNFCNATADDWFTEDSVRIAEYYYIEKTEKELVLLEDGSKIEMSDYKKMDNQFKRENPIVRTRKFFERVVKCVKTNGDEILEEYVFPGKYIPIVPVIARDFIIDGYRIFQGIVRQTKDAQRAYNAYKNNQTEMIGMAPRAPFLVAAGQTEGLEGFWNNLNTSNLAYLPYKPVESVTGQPAPPPQRQQFDPQISTLVQATEAAANDIKAITGMYDPTLGSDKREASGKAILQRQKQSELGNFGYIDNLCKSIKYLGVILMHMIPVVYDTEREIMIKEDGKIDKKFKINSMKEEKPVFLGKGAYDCKVSIGPYGEGKRAQAVETLLTLIQANPEISPLVADKLVENLEFEGSKEIADRMKILLPPELKGDLPEEAQIQIQQVQAQAEHQANALTQLVANLTAELNEAKAKLANDQAKFETQLQIAKLQAETQLLSTMVKEAAIDTREEFKARLQDEYSQSINGNYTGPSIPKAGDQIVMAGVNDPVTNDNKVKAEIDKQNALQNELKNINSNAPKVRL